MAHIDAGKTTRDETHPKFYTRQLRDRRRTTVPGRPTGWNRKRTRHHDYVRRSHLFQTATRSTLLTPPVTDLTVEVEAAARP